MSHPPCLSPVSGSVEIEKSFKGGPLLCDFEVIPPSYPAGILQRFNWGGGRHHRYAAYLLLGWLNEVAECSNLIFKECEWKDYFIQRKKGGGELCEFSQIIGKTDLDEWPLSHTKRISLTPQWVRSRRSWKDFVKLNAGQRPFGKQSSWTQQISFQYCFLVLSLWSPV